MLVPVGSVVRVGFGGFLVLLNVGFGAWVVVDVVVDDVVVLVVVDELLVLDEVVVVGVGTLSSPTPARSGNSQDLLSLQGGLHVVGPDPHRDCPTGELAEPRQVGHRHGSVALVDADGRGQLGGVAVEPG